MDEESALAELIPLALSRAHTFAKMWGQPYDEFESAALYGAWDAIKRFDSANGAHLKTYARRRIDGEIIEIERAMSEAEGKYACPTCGAELRRVFNAPAISFNAKGFYKTGG